MQVRFSRLADKQYASLPRRLRTQVEKQLDYLSQNLRHPSIQAKQYGGAGDVWQGRVNRDYRCYFQITEAAYDIIPIIPHPKQLLGRSGEIREQARDADRAGAAAALTGQSGERGCASASLTSPSPLATLGCEADQGRGEGGAGGQYSPPLGVKI